MIHKEEASSMYNAHHKIENTQMDSSTKFKGQNRNENNGKSIKKAQVRSDIESITKCQKE